MTDELLFTIKEGTAIPAERVSLASAGLTERKHLQEWVLKHPQILGTDIKIVTCEFARWRAAGDVNIADRLDVLALDRSGKLIVAELKRDKAPDTVTMQAINYAAMVRRFSLDTLAEVHADYLKQGTTSEEALHQLLDWTETLSDETLGPPRIVLLASDFGPTITNAALFLLESGVDIELRRYELFLTQSHDLVLNVSRLIPIPDAEDYMVKPRSSSTTQADAQVRRERQASTVARLVEAKHFADGTKLNIVVPPKFQENREAILHYLEDQADRGYVEWRNNSQQPLFWPPQQRSFDIGGLIRLIITLATGAPPGSPVRGQQWIRDGQDRTLSEIAGKLP